MTGDRQSLATGVSPSIASDQLLDTGRNRSGNPFQKLLAGARAIGAMEKFFHKEHGKGIPCAVGANESTCRMSLKNLPGSR
jgi:hypothetical protein